MEHEVHRCAESPRAEHHAHHHDLIADRDQRLDAGEDLSGHHARQRHHARRAALDAALIPQINSLLAVGLVALPGMMTGQILSGVEPLVAVRYQIMVMCMVFGSGGLGAAAYLVLRTRE